MVSMCLLLYCIAAESIAWRPVHSPGIVVAPGRSELSACDGATKATSAHQPADVKPFIDSTLCSIFFDVKNKTLWSEQDFLDQRTSFWPRESKVAIPGSHKRHGWSH
jgi:hypothetical protein